jgi:hypothetical protein
MERRRRCTGTTVGGRACSAWAVRGSEPALCSAHGGIEAAAAAGAWRKHIPTYRRSKRRRAAEEKADAAAERQLAPEIVGVRRLLHRLFMELAEKPEMDLATMVKLAPLAFKGALTVAQLLRDERALSGEAADGIAGAIAQALAELGTEWGVEL